jgi:hypothetical protein
VLAQVWTKEDYAMAKDDDSEPATMHVIDTEFHWATAYSEDKVFCAIYAWLTAKQPDAESEDPNFSLHPDSSMRFNGSFGPRVCLPARMVKDTLYVAHDVLGHFGFEKTYDRVADTYYQPGLGSSVRQYIQYCPQCLKNKTSRTRKQGELTSIDPPSQVEPAAFRSIN